jgi:hypothetical protein
MIRAPFILFAALLLAPTQPASAHATTSDSEADRRWAAAARDRSWSAAFENAILSLDLRKHPTTEDPGGAGAPKEYGMWPFNGFVPRPATFPTPAPGSTRPVATVEWRVGRDGIAESFASGTTPALAAAREARPRVLSQPGPAPSTSDAKTAGDTEFWSRDPEVPSDFTSESCESWQVGLDRSSWCSGWVDCYPLGGDGRYLLVVVDAVGNTVELRAVGNGETRTLRSSDAYGVLGGGATFGWIMLACDLDANGTTDYFVADFACGNGLGICGIEGCFILTDATTGRIRSTDFISEGMALLDLDRNGRAEILSQSFKSSVDCTDGKQHSFWVTQLLGFQDLGVVDLRDVHSFHHGNFTGRFPTFEWLAFEPRNRFRPLLTDTQKSELGKSGFPLYRRARLVPVTNPRASARARSAPGTQLANRDSVAIP